MCWVCKLYGVADFTDVPENQDAFMALADAVADVRGIDQDQAILALCVASSLPQSQAVH